MQNDPQKKTLAEKHRELVNSEELRKYHEEHEKKLATDPEYRKKWEKQTADLNKLFPKRDLE